MKLKIISQGNHNSQLLTLNSQQKKEMIQDYQIQEFLRQAHRVGDAGLTLCSSGNISWRIGDEALVSGTGSWVPCSDASRQPENPSGKALPPHPQKTKFRTDAPIYSRYTKQEKKLIGKIYASIGNAVADERQREALISKIEEDITR